MSLSTTWKHTIKPPLKRAWLTATGRPVRIGREFLKPGSDGYVPTPIDLAYPDRDTVGEPSQLSSCLCTEEQLLSPAFRYWLAELGQPAVRMHRKLWELAYVTQALYERGCLQPGKRGLGFAVGEEPLPKYYAEQGVEVLATDLDAEDARSLAWRSSGQHMSNCSTEADETTSAGGSVVQRSVDMNKIPSDLRDFDFTWSTCSFEHCGSIDLGLGFLRNQLDCLKPGGVAVHTTEFNLTSNGKTVEEGGTVLFRRQDIDAAVEKLRAEGHTVEPISFDPGDGEFDKHIDWPPFSQDRHLRLALKRYAATSIGLIIRKASSAAATVAA